jgi:NAD+ kinase
MRPVLVVTHTGRADALSAAQEVCAALLAAGLTPVMTAVELEDHNRFASEQAAPQLALEGVKVLGDDVPLKDVELAMVLGGDGTILKAAEIVRDAQTPLLGINLGHVGFLAESERDGLTDAVRRVVERDYLVKERLALDVTVFVDGVEEFRTWALNEAAIEKGSRERMLEVVLEIDQRPLSSFGCDGIVVATPTGSTAYSFSAGGPVVWPSVEALLVVPISAHALFAKPLVVSPKSMIAVEVMARSAGPGVLSCDGRRNWELKPGSRVEVKRSPVPVRIARFRQGVFTDRLVRKFSLPVVGWRGHEGGEGK